MQKDSDDNGGPFIHRPGSQRWAPANSQESQNEAQAGISLGREDTLSSSLRSLQDSRSDPQSKNRSYTSLFCAFRSTAFDAPLHVCTGSLAVVESGSYYWSSINQKQIQIYLAENDIPVLSYCPHPSFKPSHKVFVCVIVCLCVGLATFQAQVPLKSPTSFLLLESLLKLDLGVVTFKEHRDASGFCQARNYWGFVQSQKPCRLLGSPPDKLNTQTGEQVQSCNHICLNATYQKASFKGLSGLVHLLLEKILGPPSRKAVFFPLSHTSANFMEIR